MLTGGTETLLRVLALMGHTLQAASLLPSSIRGAGDCVPRAQEGLPFFLHLTSAALLQSRPARDAMAGTLKSGMLLYTPTPSTPTKKLDTALSPEIVSTDGAHCLHDAMIPSAFFEDVGLIRELP